MHGKIGIIWCFASFLLICVLVCQAIWLERVFRLKMDEFRQEAELTLNETTENVLKQIMLYELRTVYKQVGASVNKTGTEFCFYYDSESKTIPCSSGKDFDLLTHQVTYDLAVKKNILNVMRIDSVYRMDLRKKGITGEFVLQIRDPVTKQVVFTTNRSTDTDGMIQTRPIRLGYDHQHLLAAAFKIPYKTVYDRLFGLLIIELFFLLLFTGCLLFLIRTILTNWRIAKVRSEGVGHLEHELKKPLAALLMGMDSVIHKERECLSADGMNRLELMKMKMVKLNNMIRTMLDAFKNKQLVVERVAVDADKLIVEVVEMFRTLKNHVNISLHVQGDLKDVHLDPVYFSILFSNLMDNAIKYSGNHPEVRVECLREKDQLVLSVEDNGIGIPVRKQHRLFRQFYRLEDRRAKNVTGFGLGLAFVKRVVDACDGKIEIKSEIGKGSKFTVVLPLL